MFPNKRMSILLWGLIINSGVLAMVGIVQRLDGTDKLLWIFDYDSNRVGASFGPYP